MQFDWNSAAVLYGRKTKYDEVREMAEELIAQHGLHDWTFRFGKKYRAVATCKYRHKVIEFSIHFVDKTPLMEIHDVILHEIAHALVGSGNGHNAVWRAKCIEIGARPKRCAENAESTADYRYHVYCPKCKRILSGRHRLREETFRRRCKRCKTTVKILQNF